MNGLSSVPGIDWSTVAASIGVSVGASSLLDWWRTHRSGRVGRQRGPIWHRTSATAPAPAPDGVLQADAPSDPPVVATESVMKLSSSQVAGSASEMAVDQLSDVAYAAVAQRRVLVRRLLSQHADQLAAGNPALRERLRRFEGR